jgi:glutamine cyclotransferase
MVAAGHFKKNLGVKSVKFLPLCSLALLFACNPENKYNKQTEPLPENKSVELVPMLSYSLIAKYPHDVNSFTEGFLYYNGQLLESTGAPEYLAQTRSAVGITDLKTGVFNKKIEIDKKIYFGEGIVVMNNLLYQLTYTNQVVFTYDAKTFEKKGQYNYNNKEGWGMTSDGTAIIMSDGTEVLTYINPIDFKTIKTIQVTENGFALDHINELEFINGYIYANVWMTKFIVKIDPASGKVVGKIDLEDLYQDAKTKNINLLEMNGIAYDKENDKVLVTGKLWPYVYEVKLE